MPESAHQILSRRAGSRRERLAGVPQVVEPEAGHSCLAASPSERLAHCITPHRPTIPAYKDPIRSGPACHVLCENRQDMRRDRHRSLASICLGLGVEGGTIVLQQLDTVAADGDRSRANVHIFRAKREDLTATQTAPGSEQDSSAVPGSDRLQKRDHFCRGGYGPLFGAVRTCARDLARILHHRAVTHRSIHHGAQEPVRLHDRGPAATPPHGRRIPLPDNRGSQRLHRHIFERSQVQPQVPQARLPIPRTHSMMITKPGPSVVAESLTAEILIKAARFARRAEDPLPPGCGPGGPTHRQSRASTPAATRTLKKQCSAVIPAAICAQALDGALRLHDDPGRTRERRTRAGRVITPAINPCKPSGPGPQVIPRRSASRHPWGPVATVFAPRQLRRGYAGTGPKGTTIERTTRFSGEPASPRAGFRPSARRGPGPDSPTEILAGVAVRAHQLDVLRGIRLRVRARNHAVKVQVLSRAAPAAAAMIPHPDGDADIPENSTRLARGRTRRRAVVLAGDVLRPHERLCLSPPESPASPMVSPCRPPAEADEAGQGKEEQHYLPERQRRHQVDDDNHQETPHNEAVRKPAPAFVPPVDPDGFFAHMRPPY